ncbi:MAG: VTT domain-containing protein [bacterium]
MFSSSIFYLILKYRYLILFPILVIEGPIATLISGFLSTPDLHIFNIFFLYFFVIFADICGDNMYYWIGRLTGKKVLEKFKIWRKKEIDYELALKDYFDKKGGVTIVLGKISHGLGWPSMVAAGGAKMSYPRFNLYCTLTSIFKSAVLLLIGYYYGKAYMSMVEYIGGLGALISTFLIFIIILFFFKKYSFLKKINL